MKKFSEWIKIKEMAQAPMAGATAPMAGGGVKKPMVKQKDKTVDNVRNVLKKAPDPKSPDTIKKVSQIYDTQLDQSTDGSEIASIASKKSSVLSSLLK